jgi:hypothetical protein
MDKFWSNEGPLMLRNKWHWRPYFFLIALNLCFESLLTILFRLYKIPLNLFKTYRKDMVMKKIGFGLVAFVLVCLIAVIVIVMLMTKERQKQVLMENEYQTGIKYISEG